uniref:THAP-type domain-containing protein n=1 Tax=Dicentrarchus labrax TaxID=13489 RepID=A0A8P4G7W2_DICLA
MPDFCAAYGWSNRCSLKTRARGITFHLFPKTGKMRRQWELALRRDGFVASDRTLLRSKHFRSEDFDRTGRNVRLKDGVVPTIFNFPAHLQRLVATRSTTTSRRAEDNLPMDLSRDAPQPDVVSICTSLPERYPAYSPATSQFIAKLSCLDARPGLNKMILDMLERRHQEDEVKYGCVTLMLDAMSIKNHVQYDPQTQTMFGYVDID